MTNKGARLLIVEDDAISRNLIHNILEAEGYSIVDAETCAAARHELETNPAFDCIVLDRGLPDCDGLSLLRDFKQRTALREIPVVVQTAMADADDIRRGIEAGAHYYLAKPVQRALLGAIVAAAIEAAREVRTLRSGMQSASSAIGLLATGEFQLRTIEEARQLARALAPLCPQSDGAVLVLQELLINAIEHGNLGIGYARKSALLLDGQLREEIERRLQDPVLGARHVVVDLRRTAGQVSVTIRDQGDGFDWNDYLELSPERAFDLHGRGIFMARASGAQTIEYFGEGNVVTATWPTAG
ncbi:MAG: response regulator [Rhodocyclaceae bacterium]|nr:response regulator [Rhodocyclaceae bacterium]